MRAAETNTPKTQRAEEANILPARRLPPPERRTARSVAAQQLNTGTAVNEDVCLGDLIHLSGTAERNGTWPHLL